MVRKIPLSRSKEAIVDADLYEHLMQWKWHCLKVGYAARSTSKHDPGGRKLIFMHREIMGQVPYVDHRSGDKLDNRRENLRVCTSTQNCQNSRIRSHNQSGYKGVWKHTQVDRYYAEIKVDGVRISLGGYATAIEAGVAYNEAALLYFGEFASLNPIDPDKLAAVQIRDLRKTNTSGFRGVTRHGTRWQAYISTPQGQRYLGSFGTPEEAARVFDAAAIQYHGRTAKLNFSA